MSIEGVLPSELLEQFAEALKKVPEALEAYYKDGALKAAGILVKHGSALLDTGDDLGAWFRDIGLKVRLKLPYNVR